VTAAPDAGGAGYQVGDIVIVDDGTHHNAKIKVSTIAALTGAVTAWDTTPVAGGTSYADGATGVPTSSGLLSALTVATTGRGYTKPPVVRVQGGATTEGSATATMKLQAPGSVQQSWVTGQFYSAGSGYSITAGGATTGTGTNVKIVSSGGSDFGDRASVDIVGGAVTSVTVTTQGTGGWNVTSYRAKLDVTGSTLSHSGGDCQFAPSLELLALTVATYGTDPSTGLGTYTGSPAISFHEGWGHAVDANVTVYTGPLNGYYEYAFTYQWVDADGNLTYETDLSESVYSGKATNNAIHLVGMQVGAEVSSGDYIDQTDYATKPAPSYVAIYRKSETQSYYYYIDRVAVHTVAGVADHLDLTDQTYIDKISDDDIGVIAPVAHGVPPPCKFLVTWKRRMWYINTSNGAGEILYSELDSPEYTAVDPNPLYPNSAGSFITDEGIDAEITGAAAVKDGLVIFTRKAQYIIQGNDASDFKMTRVGTDGCISVGTVVSLKDSVFWYSPTGFRMWDINNGMTFVGEPLGAIITSAPKAHCTPAMAWRDYYVAASPDTDIVYGAYVYLYVFSTITGGWTKVGLPISTGNIFSDISSPLSLYTSTSSGAFNFLGVYSTSASGLAVTVKRKLLDMGDPTKHKVVTTLSQEFQKDSATAQTFNMILYDQTNALSTTSLTTEAAAGDAIYKTTHLRAGARMVAPGLTMTAGVPQTTIGRTIVEFAERGVARV